jgi:tRNA (guanine37-N1)-methyltransferase
MRIDVLTTFPELFSDRPPAPLAVSMPGRARASGAVELVPTNVRDFAEPPHFKTDDRPFGGGPGMVMLAEPLWKAAQDAEARDPRPATRILLSPQGERLTQGLVRELAGLPRLMLICGHYEGIDQRAIDALAPREISLGDYVLSGGELGACVLIDAIVRLLPGVLGHAESAGRDSFEPAPTTDAVGTTLTKRDWRELGFAEGRPPEGLTLLDCPHYTRPREWHGVAAPDILFGGDHRAVARWRLEQMLSRTRARRPDLLGG